VPAPSAATIVAISKIINQAVNRAATY